VAIAEPGRRVLTLGTPASNRGPSVYPGTAPIVRFLSSSASGSSCTTAHVALGSVSLFGGVITARNVTAMHGKGTVSGLGLYGSPVALGAGDSLQVGGWGQVTLEKTVGRLTAPLVVQLLVAHYSLPAGTTIAVGFAASQQVVHKAKPKKTNIAGSQKQGKTPSKTHKEQPAKPPPDFPASPSPFTKAGGFTNAAAHNPVVSIAMRYLGIPYLWGGANPKTGFDCSGLVKYVFAKLGVPLVHYAASQWHSPGGVWVSPHRLQPGDLVFFVGSDGTRKSPGHVGIYVDDGYFIDAPHTGSFVRVDRLTERKFAAQYVGARRIASLDDLHLLSATSRDGSSATLPHGVPSPLTIGHMGESLGVAASGASPLPIATVVPTAEHVAAGQSDMLLVVGGPLGAVVVLSAAAAGAFYFRKRGRRDVPEAPLQ
jgi:cell wall-associated NlpC family hydrolase